MQYNYENILKIFSNLTPSTGSFELLLTLLISKYQCADFTFNYSKKDRSYFQVRSVQSLVYSCDFQVFKNHIEYITSDSNTKSNLFLKELMNGLNRSYDYSVAVIVPVYGKLQFRVHSMPTTDGSYMNARLLQIQKNISLPHKSYGYLLLIIHVLNNYNNIKDNLNEDDQNLIKDIYKTITNEVLDLDHDILEALILLEDYKVLYEIEGI